MTNPLRGGRGRPLHPALVHFPVALYPTSLVFDWLSYLTSDGTPYVKGAYALIVTALVVSVAVAVTGVADFLAIENGSRAWRVAFTHLTVMLAASGLFLASAILRRRDLDVTSTPFGLVLLDAFALALLAVGVVLGHDLVFRHGQRVVAAPGAGGERRSHGLGGGLPRP
jgi:uncharacterized membrane protein